MKTRFVEIAPYGDDMLKMQQFAKSFDHTITPTRNGKVVAFERDDRVFGYADIVYLPVAFPAFHPAVATPKGIIEVVEGWRTHCQFAHGGEGLIAVPLDQDRTTFPKEMIEARGYARLKREIYEITEPQ